MVFYLFVCFDKKQSFFLFKVTLNSLNLPKIKIERTEFSKSKSDFFNSPNIIRKTRSIMLFLSIYNSLGRENSVQLFSSSAEKEVKAYYTTLTVTAAAPLLLCKQMGNLLRKIV